MKQFSRRIAKNMIGIILCMLVLSQAIQAGEMDVDMDNGEDINQTCAGCHGEYGEGGKEGEYPRIAGLSRDFLSRQLKLFRSRKRPNMAMVEYVDHRQMPDEDIRDISAFLEGIVLQTRLPAVDETAPDFDAYARLLASKKLMQVPRAPGDIDVGKKMYRKECGSCHGSEGWGDIEDGVPMLAGQYTNYLWRQVTKYREKIRIHDESEPDSELLLDFTDAELTDIFAYLSTVDD